MNDEDDTTTIPVVVDEEQLLAGYRNAVARRARLEAEYNAADTAVADAVARRKTVNGGLQAAIQQERQTHAAWLQAMGAGRPA
jgi:hypothetical protein